MYASELTTLQAELGLKDRDLSGDVREDGRIEWRLSGLDDTAGTAFPLVIMVLSAPAQFPGCILLQLRDSKNSTSALGMYSNVSGRVRLADYAVASDTTGESLLGESTYRLAGIRELFEEIDLDVDSAALRFREGFACRLTDRLADCQVFSLELDLTKLAGSAPGEGLWLRWLETRRLRPVTRDELFTLVTLGRVNTILAHRLSETFIPLFDGSRRVPEPQ
jgi:8-oxo-dGTP pyrophosphatase MutT (NUDIX family)